MLIYEVKPNKVFSGCCEKDPKVVMDWFMEASPGDRFIIDVKEMTEEEYKQLKEFIGP